MGEATTWIKRVMALPSFVSAFGYIKLSSKSLKPGSTLLQKEKPKVAAEKKVAAKPKENDHDDFDEDKP